MSDGGYTPEAETVRLVFEEPKYAGLEVVCRLDASLDLFLSIETLRGSRDAAAISRAFSTFAEHVLVSWNVEIPKGTPLPADATGFGKLAPAFATKMVEAWAEASADPPAPLGEPSNDGGTLAAVSIPQESA